MKIVFLAAASSIHTIRWVNGLSKEGIEIHLVSQHKPVEKLCSGVKFYYLPIKGGIGYFLNAFKARKIIKTIKPDLVNAHYASGYGTTARLLGFKPLLLSVWGSDVYDFPDESCWNYYLVRKNLEYADKVASTSHCMAKKTSMLTKKELEIEITPFGVDTKFYKMNRKDLYCSNSQMITIGTVKSMANKYGIDTLIESFFLLKNRLEKSEPDLAKKLRLRIVGDGPDLLKLKDLVKNRKLDEVTEFVGHVSHEEVPLELAKLDVYVALSRLDSESFGVAIIEASAAGRPVVVSNVGGLPEVVIDRETGFVVEKENPLEASLAIEKLVMNRELRVQIGRNGISHVESNYSWDICIKKMMSIYQEMTNGSLGKEPK